MARITNSVNLTQVSRELLAGAERGVRLALEHALTQARKVVPIEEGTLERSGKVTTERTGDGARGAISFDTPYAVRQHEDLTYRHDAGRRAKYLETTMNSEQATMARLVATELRRAAR